MLILGVLSLFVGLTLDPFWLVIGSPAILTVLVFIGVRLVLLRRAIATPPGLERAEPSPEETESEPEEPR